MTSSSECLECRTITDVITLPNCRCYILAHRKKKKKKPNKKAQQWLQRIPARVSVDTRSKISFSHQQSAAPVTFAVVQMVKIRKTLNDAVKVARLKRYAWNSTQESNSFVGNGRGRN